MNAELLKPTYTAWSYLNLNSKVTRTNAEFNITYGSCLNTELSFYQYQWGPGKLYCDRVSYDNWWPGGIPTPHFGGGTVTL